MRREFKEMVKIGRAKLEYKRWKLGNAVNNLPDFTDLGESWEYFSEEPDVWAEEWHYRYEHAAIEHEAEGIVGEKIAVYSSAANGPWRYKGSIKKIDIPDEDQYHEAETVLNKNKGWSMTFKDKESAAKRFKGFK